MGITRALYGTRLIASFLVRKNLQNALNLELKFTAGDTCTLSQVLIQNHGSA